jgi:peptide deformylase
MAIRPILQYPDDRLHRVADRVVEVTDEVKALVSDLAETMYGAPGIGLAATQVDVHKQVIVIDVSEARDDLLVLIDPEIVAESGAIEFEEGCLSVPGIYDTVQRAERITVRALDREGCPLELNAQGLLAVCIQHEMDHLRGRVFVEYLSRLKQSRIVAKLRKLQRKTL